MKKLEEMNLVDDFLTYSLMSHKIYGEEAARYILGCILQRKIGHLTVVPQRSWPGDDVENHGVRLDIYLDEEDGEIFDIEPDKNSGSGDVKTLPRRVRFYHAKIDAGNLVAGEGYEKLRNVLVIFITTYDPFELGRMVYTVKNSCVEVPGLPYEDGARTIYLYTRGTEGNPSQELRELLRYMEYSTRENVQSADIARLHEMVTEVKADKEVGLAYMKSWEIRAASEADGKRERIADDILQLLEKLGEISEEDRSRILSEQDLDILDAWYQDALHRNEQRMEIKGRAESILLMISDLGELPESLRQKILAKTDQDVLERWIRIARHVESLEQFVEMAGLEA